MISDQPPSDPHVNPPSDPLDAVRAREGDYPEPTAATPTPAARPVPPWPGTLGSELPICPLCAQPLAGSLTSTREEYLGALAGLPAHLLRVYVEHCERDACRQIAERIVQTSANQVRSKLARAAQSTSSAAGWGGT